jgi:hypothetical protein
MFQPIREVFGSAAAAAKHSIFEGRTGDVQLQPQEAVPNRQETQSIIQIQISVK